MVILCSALGTDKLPVLPVSNTAGVCNPYLCCCDCYGWFLHAVCGSRYAANFTVNLKWRDESWWTATMADLRSSAAHLPKQLAAEVANATATAATTRRQRQRRQPDQQQQQPDAAGSVPGVAASQEPAAAAADEQPRKRHKPAPQLSDNPVQPCASSDEDDVIITDDKAAPAAGGEGLSGAALRAAREEAELSARAAQQAAGAPTTVEGFKGHPLYVLERHITKYQVGAHAQGLCILYGAKPFVSTA